VTAPEGYDRLRGGTPGALTALPPLAPERRGPRVVHVLLGAVLVVAAGVGLGVWNARHGVAPQYSDIAPVTAISDVLLEPVLVRAPRLFPRRGPTERARPGEPIPVELTVYCLKGRTRRGRWVREGIVAADPRVFPLASYVEVFAGKEYLGRFLVDDTGGVIKGQILDIWKPSCLDAIKFGRKRGIAVLVGPPGTPGTGGVLPAPQPDAPPPGSGSGR
jgi:3D (Asp-Asp-Asp) domain-containing protein